MSIGEERCNVVVMKCLLRLESIETKDLGFYFEKTRELKMVRRRKVMKVKTSKSTERKAATALRQKRHSMYKGKGRTDHSSYISGSGFEECL